MITRQEFVAEWVVDKIRSGQLDVLRADVGVSRTLVRDAIAEAKAAWPGFVRDMEAMDAADAEGRRRLGCELSPAERAEQPSYLERRVG